MTYRHKSLWLGKPLEVTVESCDNQNVLQIDRKFFRYRINNEIYSAVPVKRVVGEADKKSILMRCQMNYRQEHLFAKRDYLHGQATFVICYNIAKRVIGRLCYSYSFKHRYLSSLNSSGQSPESE